MVLGQFMNWSFEIWDVYLALLVRHSHVMICDLRSFSRGRGYVIKVMVELCQWSDCAEVPLELTPTDQYGSDLGRLVSFYRKFGFVENTEVQASWSIYGELLRPVSANAWIGSHKDRNSPLLGV